MSIIKKRPSSEVIVAKEIDFVYVTSTDNIVALLPLYGNLGINTFRAEIDILYNTFCEQLLIYIEKAFSDKGNIEIHFYEDTEIINGLKEKIGNCPVISLDPALQTQDNYFFIRSSRFFDKNGEVYQGQYPHHTSILFLQQTQRLLSYFNNQTNEFFLVDDDTYTGSTLHTITKYLSSHNIIIGKRFVGIKIGENKEVESLITYQLEGGGDPTQKIDIGDCRDFLIGSSGLVVNVSEGGIGRANYILPFTSPARRMGMTKESELPFSLNVLALNLEFYSKLESLLGHKITFENISNESYSYLHKYFNVNINSRMIDFINQLILLSNNY